jgi:hypothetical protein
MGHTSIPAAPIAAKTKDSVQANKQDQAFAINVNPRAGRLRIRAPWFVFVIVAKAESLAYLY